MIIYCIRYIISSDEKLFYRGKNKGKWEGSAGERNPRVEGGFLTTPKHWELESRRWEMTGSSGLAGSDTKGWAHWEKSWSSRARGGCVSCQGCLGDTQPLPVMPAFGVLNRYSALVFAAGAMASPIHKERDLCTRSSPFKMVTNPVICS